MARPIHLLALAGLSPQVVTETIWCLAHAEDLCLPQRITVLTTSAGQAVADRLLPPALAQLGAQLGTDLPAPILSILMGPDGKALDDITTEADNSAAADGIFAAVAAATLDDSLNVHVSIAGGRKTMGALAALAMSLCARERDVLSHVLVDPRLLGREDFFFPPEPPILLPLPDGGTLSTADAKLTLARIPFVRLREKWHPSRDAGAFSSAIRTVQELLLPPRMELHVRGCVVRFGQKELRLAPSLFGTLLWLAERRKDAAPALLAALRRTGGDRNLSGTEQALAAGLDHVYLAEKISRLNRAVRGALGPAAEPFLIRTEGRRPHTDYRLALSPEAILIIEEGT